MYRKADFLFVFSMGAIFVLLITLPYIWAYQSSGSEYQFGGFLLNPIDGNSYLAKMYQGFQGSWKFTLPYTAQVGEGVYLFSFYLLLGHLSRLFSSPLQSIFHIARIAGSILLLITIWKFYTRIFLPGRIARIAFFLALFGSGFGWVASSFGLFTADFWVAEGYPFLSAYANPHFPLGLSIVIWMLTPGDVQDYQYQIKPRYQSDISFVILSFILGIILPFGIIICGVVLGGLILWEMWTRQVPAEGKSWSSEIILDTMRTSGTVRKLISIAIGGLPVLIYQIWITRTDPLLSRWNAQNLTISPEFWDLTISLGIALLLAIPGLVIAIREKDPRMRIMVVWCCLGLLMLYLPVGLQRRFMLGLYVPVAGLAAIGLNNLLSKNKGLTIAIIGLVVILAVPTNLMILLGGIQAVETRNSNILLSSEEIQGLEWIQTHTPSNALILASPESGLFIPAYTGRRVLYGHPFETVDADHMKSIVTTYFEGLDGSLEQKELEDIDYVLFGPRERELGTPVFSSELKEVFATQNLKIFDYGLQQTSSSEINDWVVLKRVNVE